MTWGPQESQKTIYETLSQDAVLQALLGATVDEPKVFDYVPQKIKYPYITIDMGDATDRGSHTTEGWTLQPQVSVWYQDPSRGKKGVQDIQKEIDRLLHNKDICIDGYDVIVMRRAFCGIVTQPDSVTLQGVQRFKLLIGEN